MEISRGNLWQRLTREGKGFTAITDLITMTTANTRYDLLYMKNASQTKLARFKEILFSQSRLAGGSPKVSFYVYGSPTVSANGTPLLVRKCLAPGNIESVMECYKSPTVTNVGVLITFIQLGEGSFVRDQDLGRYLAAGSSLLISAIGDTNGIIANVAPVWAEVVQSEE